MQSHFAKIGSPPFSFDYDGKPSSGFLSTWTHQHTTTKLDAQRTREEYIYTDPTTRLTVRCEAVRYSDFPAVEWTVYFQTTARRTRPSLTTFRRWIPILAPSRPGDYTLHYSTGSHAGPDDYQPHVAALTPGKDLPLGGASGWSTDGSLQLLQRDGAGQQPADWHRLAGQLEVAVHAGRGQRPAHSDGAGPHALRAASGRGSPQPDDRASVLHGGLDTRPEPVAALDDGPQHASARRQTAPAMRFWQTAAPEIGTLHYNEANRNQSTGSA